MAELLYGEKPTYVLLGLTANSQLSARQHLASTLDCLFLAAPQALQHRAPYTSFYVRGSGLFQTHLFKHPFLSDSSNVLPHTELQ